MSNTLKLGNGQWATGKDTVLSFSDTNNNYKPLPFSFSRDSSATVVNKDGLIETVGSGEPRIDFKDNTNGALLLEPQRTNAIRYSSDFSQWALKSNVTINSNVGLAPDGTLSADRIVFNGTTNARVEDTAQGIDAFSYTNDRPNSVWLKSESGTTTVRIGSSSSYLLTVTVTEEWQRFTYISKQGFARIKSDNATSVLAWGYQFETNGDVSLSYPTSYIPTSGQANGVTRVADECFNQPPTGIISQTELTVFYQGIVERLGGNDGHAISLSQSLDASGSSRILLYRNSGNGNMYIYVQDSTTQFSTPLLVNSDPQVNDKYAIAIKDNDLAVYCNGVKVSENNSGTIPSMQYVYFNKWNNQINEQNKIKEVKLYNTRLSNSELAALTS